MSTPSCGDSAPRHVPVLLAEMLAAIAPRSGGLYLDGTFGAGGYSRAILEAGDTRVVALDRDPAAIAGGAALVARYGGRLTLRHQAFGDPLADATEEAGRYAGVVLDLGVSSMQLDAAERGFSFRADGPLDMRMDANGSQSEGAGPSAADAVNSLPEGLLADILYQLGEEHRSRAIAAAIVRRRAERPFQRTLELADLVAAVPGTRRPDGRHAATRTFQALRIWVNDELSELARGLAGAERLLEPGGRLVVVTFHSLEDRLVKRFLAARAGRSGAGSRHRPAKAMPQAPSFRIVNLKSLSPGEAEIAGNPRARSARLRAAERTDATPWGSDDVERELPEVLGRR